MKLEKSRDSRNYPRNEKFQEMPLPKREGPCGGLVSEVPMCGTDPSEMLCLSLQGDLASKKRPPPPEDHRRALGKGLLHGPRRRRLLMSEVPLY